MKKSLKLIVMLLFGCSPIIAQTILDPVLAPFYHGVASGDPTSDAVIIWTRITEDDPSQYEVHWEMATDTLMNQMVKSGDFTTDSTMDYTVKVDVTGLQSDTWYYYQFSYNGRKSLIGRTKTLPVGDNQRIRLAVVSCARYGGGDFYNAYLDISERNDIQAVVHLGDYIYEGGGSVSGQGIQVLPEHEAVTLEDYRLRYNTYRLDPDLRRLHQQYPFITVWDDHETANDSWYGGAENHDPNTEGDWFVRKAAGQQAYFEWLPIRPKAPGSYSIYRSFSIGNLADLIMIDSRLEGRDEQAPLGDQNAYKDTSRTILGHQQMQWLKDELSNSQAKWRIIGNQVMFAPLRLGSLYFSNDQWDGYQGDRNKIITHVVDNNIENVVVVTGDIHTSWANDVPDDRANYDPNTGAGSAFVEFVGPSISTGSPVDNNLLPLIELTNEHIKYTDLTEYGYFILDLDSSRAQADWNYVSTLSDRNFTTSQPASWFVNNGERFLREASNPSTAANNPAPFAPSTVDNPPVGIKNFNKSLALSAYPNPFSQKLTVNFYNKGKEVVEILILDMTGREVYNESLMHKTGINHSEIDLSYLNKGPYLMVVKTAGFVDKKMIVKMQ